MNIKTVGIIGGLSPESTAIYYKAINEGVVTHTNKRHQAKIVLISVDGGEIWSLRQQGDWEGQGRIVAEAAQGIERAGADFILLAGNTMHKVAEAIVSAISIPFLHIVDATAERIRAAGVTTIGLTGTSFSLTEQFYVDRLKSFGISAIIPSRQDVEKLDQIIYHELCWGVINPQSRQEYSRIVNDLITNGAGGVILGCTELTMLMPIECSAPLFDTTRIHIEAALAEALRGVHRQE